MTITRPKKGQVYTIVGWFLSFVFRHTRKRVDVTLRITSETLSSFWALSDMVNMNDSRISNAEILESLAFIFESINQDSKQHALAIRFYLWRLQY